MPRPAPCKCEECPGCVKRRKSREWARANPRSREYYREYYKSYRANPENLETARERSRKGSATRRAKIKALLTAAKDHPCVDCGTRLPPECMDLDHVHGEKAFGLSKHRERYSTFEEIHSEIAKCEVRCPNCHRLRHWREREGQDEAEAA